ncbi:hypothetical protein TH25_02350 [Thalassospira profundimaris]|uniref:Uncharacterized protein n=1 Tax=Thalassospira profundimaris TaxID=502049 RepID=A0A367XN60_9PROT|nr:hypothetical protein [Thalassospira profundimaris]RCK54182.1 hypothetical protein TH25_02350 [Thalassospira profundimaris]
MAGFWSTLGLVFRAVFGVVQGQPAPDPLAPHASRNGGNGAGVCGIADFGCDDPDLTVSIKTLLADFPAPDVVAVSQRISISSDTVDPFFAVKDAQSMAWNAALRQNCTSLLWGHVSDDQKYLSLWFASRQNGFSPHELFLAQKYDFTLPLAEDFAEALKLLLLSERLRRADSAVLRSDNATRLAKALEARQDRVRNPDFVAECGEGVSLAYATACLALAENGDRGWCQLGAEAIEPLVATCLGAEASQDRDALAIHISRAGTSGVENLRAEHVAVLALYGHLLNWASLGSSASRVPMMAVDIWRILLHRFEYAAGATVSKSICLLRLGEACCALARETRNEDLAEAAVKYLRRALGGCDANSHPVLYGLITYHLGDALIAHGELIKTGVEFTNIIPFFQATLKVCGRRENLYLWGRAMFALATVQAMQGRENSDITILRTARMNFIQAQQNLEEAGARSAARTALGGQMRVEAAIHEMATGDKAGKHGVDVRPSARPAG